MRRQTRFGATLCVLLVHLLCVPARGASASASARAPAPAVSASARALLGAPVCEDALAVGAPAARGLLDLLAPLAASPYLAFFHVAIDAPCPFWADDSAQCAMRECSVSGCDSRDVPPSLLASDAAAAAAAAAASAAAAAAAAVGVPAGARTSLRDPPLPPPCATSPPPELNDVDRSHAGAPARARDSLGWAASAAPDDWTVQDAPDAEMIYVDLRKNPERFTGYAGEKANRIWSAIYDENCFAISTGCRAGVCAPDTCKEERVFYRAVSGLHTSITMHIAKAYLHGSTWGSNLQVFANRVHAFPEREQNLLMTLALVLRAVAKASPSLDPSVHSWAIGDDVEDRITRERASALLAHPLLAHECDERVFDESDMFAANAQERLPEFRSAFRNISMIMDCVGCEKCRLWGKLQFLGLGTALRILVAEEDQFELKRNEVVALFNLLHKLLSSVVWIQELAEEADNRSKLYFMAGRVFAGFVFMCVCLALKSAVTSSDRSGKSPEADASKTRLATQSTGNGKSTKPSSSPESPTDGGVPVVQTPVEAPPLRRRRRAVPE